MTAGGMIARALHSPDSWLLALMLLLGAWAIVTILRNTRK